MHLHLISSNDSGNGGCSTRVQVCTAPGSNECISATSIQSYPITRMSVLQAGYNLILHHLLCTQMTDHDSGGDGVQHQQLYPSYHYTSAVYAVLGILDAGSREFGDIVVNGTSHLAAACGGSGGGGVAALDVLKSCLAFSFEIAWDRQGETEEKYASGVLQSSGPQGKDAPAPDGQDRLSLIYQLVDAVNTILDVCQRRDWELLFALAALGRTAVGHVG